MSTASQTRHFFYFKDISGRVVDSFTVISNVELPVVNSLLPASANAGGNGFTLTVNGANFGNGATVRWNNENRPTSVISPTQLSATISTADIGPGNRISCRLRARGNFSQFDLHHQAAIAGNKRTATRRDGSGRK
jgi:hypothetical protein